MAFGAYRLTSCHALKRTMRSGPQEAPSNCVRTCLSNSKCAPKAQHGWTIKWWAMPGNLSPRGFGAQVRDALQDRMDFLVEQGLAERRGSRVVLARNLLSTLRDRELAEVGKVIQHQTGLVHRPLRDGERANGIYRRSVQLVSGRFAMLDDGMGFSLVPWRPVVEQRLGQQVSAIVRGSSVTWELGRQRGR